MLRKEIPSTFNLHDFDDLGLINGCRECGQRPSFVVVPEELQSVTILCCSDPACYKLVSAQAQEMLKVHNRKLNKKREFKRTRLGRFLRIIRYLFWVNDRNNQRRMRDDPLGFWTEHDRAGTSW